MGRTLNGIYLARGCILAVVVKKKWWEWMASPRMSGVGNPMKCEKNRGRK